MSDSDEFSVDDYGYSSAEDDLLSPEAPAQRARYHVLDKERMHEVKEGAVEKVQGVLCVSRDQAVRVLRHFGWNVTRANESWFVDQEELSRKLGIVHGEQLRRTQVSGTCNICFETTEAHRLRGAACGHFFCTECWTGYVEAKFTEGRAQVLDMRCPQPDCGCQVLPDLYRDLVDASLLGKYEQFETVDFVEASKDMLHCPRAGCDNAVKLVDYLGSSGTEALPVECACGYMFCSRCLSKFNAEVEPHGPAFCEDVQEWARKSSTEAANIQWILVNTKNCPKCHKPIEKNSGCMHMTCAQCRHEFCWLCLGDWSRHGEGSGGFYNCNRYEKAKLRGQYTDEQRKRENAKAALDRYVHYFERFTFHDKGIRKARADSAAVEQDKEKIANVTGTPPGQLRFLTDAWETVAQGARTLKWSYCLGFSKFTDTEGDDARKKELFEFKQGDAELSLDRLRKCLEDGVRKTLARLDHDSLDRLATKHDEIEREFHALKVELMNLDQTTRKYFTEMMRELEGGVGQIGGPEDSGAAAGPSGMGHRGTEIARKRKSASLTGTAGGDGAAAASSMDEGGSSAYAKPTGTHGSRHRQ